MEPEQLLNIPHTESQRIEFKRQITDKLERSIVAFLNSKDGGIIYLGVDDDGNVIGLENADAEQRKIADRIKNNIRGETLGLFDIILENYHGKYVIKLIVSSGTEKPYYLKEKGMTSEGCYIRNGSRNEQMTTSMIEKAFARRTRNSLSVIAAPRQDLSFEQLHIYYQEHGKILNDQFAQSLNFLTEDNKYNLNAWLFADENDITIKIAKFSGVDKTDLIENEEYGYCSIIKSCISTLEKLNIENRTFARINYPFRQEERLIDTQSLREAIINAFVHNDYSDLMSPAFYIFSNRIEIVSYGGLIDGMSKEELVSGCSRPRNREIMRVFRDVDLVEQLGSGMNRMMKAYTQDIFSISPNFFLVSFPYKTPEGNISPNVRKYFPNGLPNVPIEVPKVTQRTFEAIRLNPNATIVELSEKLSLSESATKKHIALLKKAGVIKRVGGKTYGHWEINSSDNSPQKFPNDSPQLPLEMPEEVHLEFPKGVQKTFEAIRLNPSATIKKLSQTLELSERTIKKHIALLKKAGMIKREGGKTHGFWKTVPETRR